MRRKKTLQSFRFNPINLDPLTETYGVGFYLQYLARWPEYFLVAEAPSGDLMGYIMGKSEGIYLPYFNYRTEKTPKFVASSVAETAKFFGGYKYMNRFSDTGLFFLFYENGIIIF